MDVKTIIIEEFKKEGLVITEEVAELALHMVAEKILPRLAAESDNATIKTIAAGFALVWPTLKPEIEKKLDFNGDGVVGVKAE